MTKTTTKKKAKAVKAKGPRSLLEYRVIIVTGKGGTGKTTVAACLAEAARRAGKRVMLAETATAEAVAAYFEDRPEPLGYAGRELRPNLHAMRIDPNAALADYLGLQIGMRRLAERVLRTDTFQQLLEAVPGWRELIVLGKVWHLEQKRDASKRPAYDLIIVDAPATGHGLTFLDVPRVVQQAVHAGPLSRHAGWVEALIHDRDRTLLLPVTLPEELPVLETLELIERARTDIDIGVDRVIVNAMPPVREKKLARSLIELPETLRLESLPPISVIRDLLIHAERRENMAYRERERVSRLCGLPVVDLPYSPTALVASDEWQMLVDSILNDPSWPDAIDPDPTDPGENAR
jgi:Anion-transporting ATPase